MQSVNENKKANRRLNKISEYEAIIGLNEMIIEDYADDKVFSGGLKAQNEKLKQKIDKLRKKGVKLFIW